MAINTYTLLQAAVKSWINRSDADAKIPDFITLAEADLNSKVRVRQNMTTSTLTLTGGTSAVSLPSDFLEDIELNYDGSDDPLDKGSFNDIDRARGNSMPSKPIAYAITGSQIIFNSISDQTYTLTLRYYKKWDIASEDANWLLTTHPDAYLFGSVAEAYGWLGDVQGAAYATSKMQAAIDRAMKADSRTRGGELRVDESFLRRTWRF